MSGVEVVGIVLGSLPLLISALEHYSNGISVAKRFRDCRDVFDRLLLTVRTEHAVFQNTCRLLLTGIVPSEEIGDLLKKLGPSRWQDNEGIAIERKLQYRLGDAFEDYMKTMEQLRRTMKDFGDKLKLDSDGQIPFRDEPFKKLFKKLHLSVTYKDYEDLIRSIKDHNRTLSKLTKQSQELEHTNLQHSSAPNFKFIQLCARKLYGIFKSSWKCQCAHTVNLRLEDRLRSADQTILKDEVYQNELRFRVAFASGLKEISRETWREADAFFTEDDVVESGSTSTTTTVSGIVKLDGSKTTKKGVRFVQSTQVISGSTSQSELSRLRPIQDLCQALKLLQQPSNPCLGYLSDQCSKHKITIFCPKDPGPTCLNPLLSLRALLQEKTSLSRTFSRGIRLSVALVLASSVLQLHNSSWLGNTWSKDDIHFTKTSSGIVFDHPFVSPDARALQKSPIKRLPRYIRNSSLFSLGVVLIELWFGKSLEKLYDSCDLDEDGQPHATTVFDCADRLVDDLYDEAGTDYAEVVRRCIRCDFDRPKHDLGDDDFQREVHSKIIELLQKFYRQFRGVGP